MARFILGQLLTTPGVKDAVERTGEELLTFVGRHSGGDWGTVDATDAKANDRALIEGARILSAYLLSDGTKIWVITEADRSATTMLLPDEY